MHLIASNLKYQQFVFSARYSFSFVFSLCYVIRELQVFSESWYIWLIGNHQSMATVRSILIVILPYALHRCDGNLETCPGAIQDKINITSGTAQFMDQSFHSVTSYQHLTNKLYLRLDGFSVTCGPLTLKWFLLPSSSSCSASSAVSGTFLNSNTQQTVTGKNLAQGNLELKRISKHHFPVTEKGFTDLAT